LVVDAFPKNADVENSPVELKLVVDAFPINPSVEKSPLAEILLVDAFTNVVCPFTSSVDAEKIPPEEFTENKLLPE
jgi:hypothetical protein